RGGGGAGGEDEGVADEDAQRAAEDQGGRGPEAGGRPLAGQVPAGNQGDVLRQGKAQAAGDEQREYAHVPGGPVELQEEVVDCLVQSPAPLWTNVRAYSRPSPGAT